jgi:amino acid adenylation domain-containing protein
MTELSKTDRPKLYPLTIGQRDIWVAQILDPSSDFFTACLGIEFFGTIDVALLEQALRRTISENDGQHLIFKSSEDGPRQCFRPFATFHIPVLDFSGEDNPRAAAMAWMCSDRAKPFDLANGPLFRYALIKTAADRFFLYGANHHLISDLFGSSLFVRRIAEVYSALVGHANPPPSKLLSVLELLEEDASYHRSDRYARDRDYWREQLASRPEAITLSGRAPHWPGGVLKREAIVHGAKVERLERLGAACGASLSAVMMAAVAIYQGRLTGTADLILGMAVSGRTNPKMRRVVGMASNIVPLRLSVDPGVSLRALLGQVGRRVRDALRHQRYWTSEMRRDLGLTPDQPPLYGMMVNFKPVDEDFGFAGVPIQKYDLAAERIEDFMIAMQVGGPATDLRLEFNSNERHYDENTLAAHGERFLRLIDELAAASGRPDQPLYQFDLLSATERSELLTAGSPAAAMVTPQCFPTLFEAQVSAASDAAALVFGEEQLTYDALNLRANRLAHRLIREGIGPESRVGLFAERSPAMIVGLLAIMKAGAAYLPLDPVYPAARLAFMLADAKPSLILTDAGVLPPPGVPHLVITEAEREKADERNPTDRDRSTPLSINHPAFVIYTSGSTGRPKGVVVTHVGIAALAAAQRERLGVTAASRVLQFASLNFDASLWEVVMALTSGAALVLAPPDALSGPPLRALLAAQRITHATLPPAVLQTLGDGEGAPLGCLVVAGEACPAPLVAQWSAGRRMVNAYGPTESTVCATISAPLDGASAPIGTPILGSRVYVLDAALELAPIGATGELYIAGTGLARGYLFRPGLTAERFIADPYGPPGSRMYRTGDLARWRPDGQLDFLGRVDQQVKVRGFRIELGEIKARLEQHPGVREAVVLVREDHPGEKRLAAYYVGGDDVGAEALRAHLSAELPDYMAPSAYVRLDRLPLTPNGKLDREALPAPEGSAHVRGGYEPPAGGAEEMLAQIWSELLGVARIGRNDNFFELGGHSLLAVTLIERLRRQGLQVDVRTLFTSPTLAGLAAAAEAKADIVVPPNLIPEGCSKITPQMLPLLALSQAEIDAVAAAAPNGAVNIQDIYPLTPLQEGILFHHLLAAEGDAYVLRSLVAFDGRERLDGFLAALNAVIVRHDILRTGIVWEGLPQPAQVVWRKATLPVEEVTLDPAGGDAAAQLRDRFDPRHARLDVRRAPLMRGLIAQDGANDRWLLLLLHHHLALDHTTLEIVIGEVQAYLLGRGGDLPAPVAFRNFVAQARLGVSVEEHEAFFRAMLGDVEEPTLPFGLTDMQREGRGVEEAQLALDPALARRLRSRARALGVSAASLFHLAWAAVLARTSGREDVVFGTVLFGRMQGGEGAERAVGMFINTLPVRLSVGDGGVAACVRRTHAALAALLRHEHAPLALAQRCSGVPAPLPLFSALLNYRYSLQEGAARAQPAWKGIEFLSGEERTTYPLTLSVDDLGKGFILTAQVQPKIGAARICSFVEMALTNLAGALEEAPETPVRRLEVLPEAERNRVLEEWNATEAAYPQDKCVHELFEAQAERTPGAVAAELEDRQLSYGELNKRANQLAHYLRGLGMKPNGRVAICVERSVEMIVGLLAILKAGGACVPLDPSYPAARLAFMLQDSAPAALLADSAGQAALAGCSVDAPVIDLADAAQWAGAPAANLDCAATGLTPRHLAYVIYTSGSTGTPKGVMVEHRSVVNRLIWMQAAYGLGSDDAVLQKTPFSFDVSVWEFFWAPLAGAWASFHQPPEGPVETALAEIWCDVLRTDHIGRHDDFFELGGNSLTAMQVVSRLRDCFGLELPLKTLFQARTLKAIATEVNQATAARAFPSVVSPVASVHSGPTPLSYSQERMWLIQSLDPENTAYNMAFAVKITGPLATAALGRAFNVLVQRHEILRTTIRLLDDRPVQEVQPWIGPSLALVDCRSEGEGAAMRAAEMEAQRPFDLSQGPVIRAKLYRTGAEAYLLTVVLHHIAGDQWSVGVFGRELALLYNGLRRGEQPALPPQPISYRDYAVWQRDPALADEFERQLSYWRKQLADLPVLDLPTDWPRPRLRSLRGAFCDAQLSDELLNGLARLGREVGSTFFMTMLTGFAALLNRITGQTDIPIGVPVANRTHSATEGVVGTFVNTLVLRIDLAGNPSFRELLLRVSATALDAFAHQDISFDRLVQEIGQEREPSRAPLTQVLFNVANAPMHEIRLDDVTWEPMPLDRRGAQFELSLSIDSEVTHRLVLEYNTDLFDRTTIERAIGHYLTLLEGAVAAPETVLSTLPMLTIQEQSLLQRWNATAATFPRDRIFVQLFEAQAKATPAAPAVSFEESVTSYGDLNSRANAVAHALQALGVGPGSLVGLSTRRSPALLAALIGIQKSGGAYVPLDPGFPAERLAYMLADSGAKVLVTDGDASGRIELPDGVATLDLDSLSETSSPDNPVCGASPTDTAYVIYTSGSTGRPKGVAVSHGSVMNFLWSMQRKPGLSASDTLAAVTTISFDIAVLELYLPLLTGARIELVPHDKARDGVALGELIERSGATVLQATPGTWRLLIEAGWRGVRGFRAFCGGEPLPRDLADALLDRTEELWNLYGPTETTVWSTVDRVRRDDAPISIGEPIANTAIHILDTAGEPAPIGVTGEIHIGGLGVANGYHRRPALTAERFIADRFSDQPGARLYRTGDLGRWGADGKLYHLGRVDHQVKIRGFRVELGEVEAALSANPAVLQAVANAAQAHPGDQRLVAYIVYRDGEELTAGDFRRQLRQQLPDFMIPSVVVPLDSMPLTPNGKIDRNALPDPFKSTRRPAKEREGPAPGLEERIAEIWRSILSVDAISAEDNFFELGGHSLLSLRVALAVEKETGYRLDPRALFFNNLREVSTLIARETAGSVEI